MSPRPAPIDQEALPASGPTWWARGRAWLDWVPFKGAIFVALVLLGFKEFFPFSHFPM